MCNLIESDNVVACMDDFLVATEIVEKHLEMLERIFKLLIENRLELHLSKCHFIFEEIEFLGYVVSAKSIHSNDSRIATVKKFSFPKCRMFKVFSSSILENASILENS